MKTFGLCIALAAVALMSACSGGTSEALQPSAAADKVPPSATASVRAYTQFAGSLGLSESQPPLSMDDAAAPTSETDEPLPVT